MCLIYNFMFIMEHRRPHSCSNLSELKTHFDWELSSASLIKQLRKHCYDMANPVESWMIREIVEGDGVFVE